MLNFTFYNPTRIHFGKGQIAHITEEIPKGTRVLMTYGGGSVHRNGVYDQVRAALGHTKLTEFGGIEANPRFETLMRATKKAREVDAEFLLAVGGGSVIDGTKFIAAACHFQGDAWDILVNKVPIKSAMPFGTVLTLPATGSEMNSGAVITRTSTQEKLPFGSRYLYPQFSILDPSTTFTLPPRQVANGIVDAFVHVLEQYLTYPVQAPVQDRFAEGLLRTLIEIGPQTLAEPHDYNARAGLMWVATMALNGLIGAGVPQDWSSHMIGHEITALHGLDHAQTLAIVLPANLQYRRSAKHTKLVQYARRVWDLEDENEEALIDGAIDHTRNFFTSLNVPTRLSDYGIGSDAIPELVARLERHGMVKLGEKRDVNPKVSRDILLLAV